MGSIDRCSSCIPANSVNALKDTPKVLAVSTGLTSSFLHPSPDFCQKGHCFLCTSCLTPVPVFSDIPVWHVIRSSRASPSNHLYLPLYPSIYNTTTPTPQPFYGPFFRDHPGEPVLPDFIVQGEINRGSHTDHPAGCHSIRTKQCPPPPSPIYNATSTDIFVSMKGHL